MKRIASLLMVWLLIMSVSAGCQTAPVKVEQSMPQDDTVATPELDITQDTMQETEASDTLWIVMEEHEAMETLVNLMVSKFGETHPAVEIEVEVLPNGNKQGKEYEDAREIALQRLRTAIMARKGPDIYLMPSVTTTYEMLFQDVNQAMRNGLFEDIGAYYDADTELGKESLLTSVMDAGVLDGARYVLPLRYDMPVAYVDTEQFAAAGGSMDMFDGGIMNLLEQVLATESKELAKGAFIATSAELGFAMNFLGQCVDYDEQEVLIEEQTVADFLTAVQRIRSTNLIPAENWEERVFFNSPSTFGWMFSNGDFWTAKSCMYIGTMQDVFDNAIYAKVMEKEIAMLPMSDVEGKITADVTYYGAVGDACENTALAYEFLRLFLTEDAQIQWNQDTANEGYYLGWPVRIYDDISAIWQMKRSRLRTVSPFDDSDWTEEQKEDFREIKTAMVDRAFNVTNEDMPVLNTAVDRIQFSIDLESQLRNVVYGLNDGTTCEPISVDIDEAAAEFVDELMWHLAEG